MSLKHDNYIKDRKNVTIFREGSRNDNTIIPPTTYWPKPSNSPSNACEATGFQIALMLGIGLPSIKVAKTKVSKGVGNCIQVFRTLSGNKEKGP